MNKIILTFLFIFLSLMAISCVSSQYILTAQYTNPKTNTIERIDIPVSQYNYDKINVGDDYNLKIHTVWLGIKLAITDNTRSSAVSMMDLIPTVGLLASIFFGVYGVKNAKTNKDIIITGILFVIILGFIFLGIAAMQPDFSTTGTVIDKTFQITSR